MKYKGFDIAPKFIKEDKLDWVMTGNGTYVIGSKRGINYFIKKNASVVYPTRGVAPALYEVNLAAARFIENKQASLRNAMKSLSFESDNIIVEEDNFWDDDDKKFVTITRLVDGALSDDFAYHREDKNVLIDAMKQMATLIKKLHAVNVIHGDLKEKNFISKRDGSKLKVYVLDFDCSYLSTQIPEYDSVPYSEGYQSPEIVKYIEGEGDEEPSIMTPKTDIFTLGVIFHRMITGEFPATSHEGESTGDSVLNSHPIILDRKLDFRLGENCGSTLISLVNWMIALEAENRPTAEMVFKVLNDEETVDSRYIVGDDELLIGDLWELDKKIATLDKDKLTELNITSFKKINEGGKQKYLVKKDGADYKYTILELLDLGYVTEVPLDIPTPWDGHLIEFNDSATLRGLGVSSIQKVELFNKKAYLVVTMDGLRLQKSHNALVREGYAKEKEAVSVSADMVDEPWDSDVVYASQDVFDKRNIKAIRRYVEEGEQKYMVEFNHKDPMIVNRNNLLILGYLVKKK